MMQNNVPIQQFLFLVIATILNVALGCHTYKFERGPTKNQNSQVGLILQSGLRGQDSNKKRLQHITDKELQLMEKAHVTLWVR